MTNKLTKSESGLERTDASTSCVAEKSLGACVL